MNKILLLFILSASINFSNAQWLVQNSGFPEPSRGINQICIVDQNIAWASGYDGSGNAVIAQDFTRTLDGGDSWQAGSISSAPSDYEWSCLAAVDKNTAWAALYNSTTNVGGGVYKTADGGSTWTEQGAGSIFIGATSFPDVIYFWDENIGVVVGDPVNNEYEIYTTSDGGLNWKPVDVANIPAPLTGEYAYTRMLGVGKDGVIWFGTNKGRVYKSKDKGFTWGVYQSLASDVQALAVKDVNTSWVRRTTKMYQTNDGGTTWSQVLPASGHFFKNAIAYVPYTVNTLVSTGSNFSTGDYGSSYSLDGGLNWVTIDSAIQHLSVSFYNNVVGWAGGFNIDEFTDGISKYDGGFIATGIEAIDPSVKFNLYPNPSNGLFYFSFDAGNNAPIQLKVTDITGKLIFSKTYADKSQTWLRSFDLRNFGKGIYFLEVENNGQHFSNKLVIN
ncbi:MAG: T9SS type A sorting domain-containing protein [Chitinophagales bacterium]|nr:T9SS type A sorting domain-containing protein [Chitinophagales bacterium]